jgi:hypothetical protein
MNFVPLIGWSRAIFMSMLNFNSDFFIYLFLQISFIILINIYILITTNDYFEDVLSSTENKDIYISNRKNGKRAINFNFNFNKNKRNAIKPNCYGSDAFHWKNKMNFIKKDFHYFFGIQTLIFLILGIVGILIKQYKFQDIDYSTIFTILTVSILYIYTIFSMRAGTQEELDMPFFYLIPENNIKKIISLNKLAVEPNNFTGAFGALPKKTRYLFLGIVDKTC